MIFLELMLPQYGSFSFYGAVLQPIEPFWFRIIAPITVYVINDNRLYCLLVYQLPYIKDRSHLIFICGAVHFWYTSHFCCSNRELVHYFQPCLCKCSAFRVIIETIHLICAHIQLLSTFFIFIAAFFFFIRNFFHYLLRCIVFFSFWRCTLGGYILWSRTRYVRRTWHCNVFHLVR